MTENMEAFLKLALEDSNLRARIEELNNTKTEQAKQAAIEFAQQYGINLSLEDIDAPRKNEELSDESLAAVAGGYKICLFGHCIGEKSGPVRTPRISFI